MFKVTCPSLELRGIANKTTKSGKAFYLLNVEDNEGNSYQLYCPDFNSLQQGLNKGDNVSVEFNVHYYQGNERLIVTKVEKVAK